MHYRRVSCFYLWNTPEGGPCLFRPTPSSAFDGPGKGKVQQGFCIQGVDDEGKCVLHKNCKKKGAYCDENNVLHDAPLEKPTMEIVGPWSEDLSSKEKTVRWTAGFSNQFGFPWEIGMYWKFKIGEGESQRPMGCPGIDEDFGTISDPKWPFLISPDIPIRASHAMQCEKNEDTASIVEALADDNEHFAEKFLAGWQQMISNGYSDGELVDGPENAWIGYHSLEQQGIKIDNFESYIAANAPLIFTDPQVCIILL